MIAQSQSEGRPTIDRLLIVRLSAMGDVIHALPAAQALRQAFPEAMIGWLIEERWAELLCAPGTSRRGLRSEQRPLVDWVHTVSLKTWRKSLFTTRTLEGIVRVWKDVHSVHYDAAIDLQGAIRSAALARWSGARFVYGAAEPRESPASIWYTRQKTAHGAHVIAQSLSVASALVGSEAELRPVEMPHHLETEQQIGHRLAERGIIDFAILNPGAGWGAKRWPAERYGLVAKALAGDGVRTIINYGPGEEELARETEAASEGTAIAMNCTLTELIALTRRAKLFIGGDTGPMHLAAALRIPVVAIFGPTDPARNGPYGTASVVLRNPASPTTHARRSAPDEGLLAISADSVVRAARQLLAAGKTTAGAPSPVAKGRSAPSGESAHG